MNVIIDTREKPKAIEIILAQFNELGVSYARSKLYVGDYQSVDNAKYVIDRKQKLAELCANVSADHERFRKEIVRANEFGIHICFLIEDDNIKCMKDVREWVNPRLKVSPMAKSGPSLYKTMRTMLWKYDVSFAFCSKKETGYKIYQLLKEHEHEQ